MITDGQITLSHITQRPSATLLLLLPPVHGRTDYTCPYYIKTFCHTPYCSYLMFTDGQITLAHITPRPSATPLLLLPPVHGRTDYTCPYYTKTFCHTPYCSYLLFTDGRITLTHITSRIPSHPWSPLRQFS